MRQLRRASLAKYLAHCWRCLAPQGAERSSPTAEVTVGGEVITDPARDVGEGRGWCGSTPARRPSRAETWAVNKPAGVVSTASEPGRGLAVVELVASAARLYPVGRLDAASTGLLLLTNDGELANRLTHPRYEVAKAYRVELGRPPSDADLEQLRRGVELEDGPTRPAKVRRLDQRRGRDRPARRAQPPGAAHGRGGWQPGGGAAPRPFRPDRLDCCRPERLRRLEEDEIASLWEDVGR